jgi:glycosyltransferase involved in cell wall biosynthesis
MITYNHEPYIRKAIECILTQKTNFPFELVIGEDCSTDGTRDIVFDYQKNHPDIIRVVTSEKNVGMKKNWCRVIMACRGDYIAYCEGDDYWQRDDKLQIQVDYLEAHPDCGLVYSDCDWYFAKSGHTIRNCLKSSGKDLLYSPQIIDIVTKKVDIRTCTVLARRELIDQIIEADAHLHHSEKFKMSDIQLWAELSLIAKIHYINESLATYQILEESATQSKDKLKGLLFWISDAEMYIYLCNKHNLPEYIKKQYEDNWRRGSLQRAFIEKRRDMAEIIRKKYPKLSLKDWVWYQGTKNPLMRPVVSLLQVLFERGG